jgi:hypothetical protein
MPLDIKVIVRIAEQAHEANRVFVQATGGEEKKPWRLLENSDRERFIRATANALETRVSDPEKSHKLWSDSMLRDGWKHGDQYDETAKTHPNLVPYENLTPIEKFKDVLFLSIVTPFYA